MAIYGLFVKHLCSSVLQPSAKNQLDWQVSLIELDFLHSSSDSSGFLGRLLMAFFFITVDILVVLVATVPRPTWTPFHFHSFGGVAASDPILPGGRIHPESDAAVHGADSVGAENCPKNICIIRTVHII